MSVGIATMHYLGMSALTGSIFLFWSSDLIVLSILLGLVFTAAAVRLAFRATTLTAHGVAGMLLALGILTHHFVGMGAVTIVPVAGKELPGRSSLRTGWPSPSPSRDCNPGAGS